MIHPCSHTHTSHLFVSKEKLAIPVTDVKRATTCRR